jgi:transposase
MNYPDLIIESADALKQLEKEQKLVQFQKRMRFLWLLKTAAVTTQEQAGKEVEWKLRQSQKIWGLYREKGLAVLLENRHQRAFGKLSSCQLARLQNHLAEFGADSLDQVRDYIQSSCGVSYGRSGVCELLGRLKIKLKTARPSNYQKDEAAVENFKKKNSASRQKSLPQKRSSLKMN